MRFTSLLLILCLCLGCKKENKVTPVEKVESTSYLLTLLDADQTNIHFKNSVIENYDENFISYEFIYNGSGVAVGDINNDGLLDIYFGGNSSDDKLYLNEGDLKFKDISSILGPENLKGWTAGVNFVDINADGLLDIYVCRSGPNKDPKKRKNKLFINQGNLSFTEDAQKYDLDKDTYSVQSAFFDYDLDGDLDMYLSNHPDPSWRGETFDEYESAAQKGTRQTDFFFENDNGKFVDRSNGSGLVSFGYRHGIAVGDINNDLYPDLYISSDFDHSDLFYLNNKDKTFTNVANDHLNHISWSSMGNEMTDINNDG